MHAARPVHRILIDLGVKIYPPKSYMNFLVPSFAIVLKIHGVLDQMIRKKSWSVVLAAEPRQVTHPWKTNISDKFNCIIYILAQFLIVRGQQESSV
jgi:hypothetical protein